jgi:hypothetical protein
VTHSVCALTVSSRRFAKNASALTSGDIHVTKNSTHTASMRMLPGLLLASLGIAGVTHAAPQVTSVRTVFPTDDSSWRSGPPGLPGGSTFAVISGDPAQAGPFMIRVELPSGYRLAPYRRPRDENIVVLAGAIQVGTRTLASGSFIRLRANQWHFLSTQSGATLQIFGDGPFALSAGM